MKQNSSLKEVICDILHNNEEATTQLEWCYNIIENHHGKKLKDEMKTNLKNRLQKLKTSIRRRYEKSNRNWSNTKRDNKAFFDEEFEIMPEFFENDDPFSNEETLNIDEHFDEEDDEEQVVPDMEPSTSKGTKRKSFDELSSESQRRKRVDELDNSVKETKGSLLSVLYLAIRLSKQEGKVEGTKMLKSYVEAYKKGEDLPKKTTLKQKQLDLDIALGLQAFNNLSQNQYNNIQKVVKIECANVFPPAKKLLTAKKSCYPENLTVTDTKAAIPIEDLTLHTTKRVIEAHKTEIYDKIKKLPSESTPKIIRAEMIVTWGMDGTTGQSQYNQGCTRTQENPASNNEIVEDKSLLTVSMSVQQLRYQDDGGNFICLWDNEKSQSVYSVRPIQLEFAKETKTKVRCIYNDVKTEISKLEPQKFICEDMILEITYAFYPTMLDGKVYTDLTGTTGYSRCQICGSGPNEMSDLKNIDNGRFEKTHENFVKENLLFNTQPLHTSMNVLTSLYDLSARQYIQKHWEKLSELEHAVLKVEKDRIKKAMWDAFHVRINMPKQGGAGTSDTGNIARKVLAKPVLLAKTLDLDEELVKRICYILKQIRSSKPVDNLHEFDQYCRETNIMFLTTYDWYKIPVSLHRVLAHAKDYMEALPLPLGRMSEEAGESQNKYLRKDRELRARKTSRIDNLTDVIHRRLYSSDPVILKKYMDVINKRLRRRNVQEELEMPDEQTGDEDDDEEEIELIEPEGEGYDYSQGENYDYIEYDGNEHSDGENDK